MLSVRISTGSPYTHTIMYACVSHTSSSFSPTTLDAGCGKAKLRERERAMGECVGMSNSRGLLPYGN